MSRVIKLSNKKETLVDDYDFEWLKKYKWSYTGKNGYAARMNGKKKVYLHRFIIRAPDDLQVDHINHNKLDNRRKNLRIVTQSQSNMNKRKTNNKWGYKGVYFYDHRKYYKKKTNLKTNPKSWVASIKLNGKIRRLGYFETSKEAAIAYNKAAIKYFGKYASLNKI